MLNHEIVLNDRESVGSMIALCPSANHSGLRVTAITIKEDSAECSQVAASLQAVARMSGVASPTESPTLIVW